MAAAVRLKKKAFESSLLFEKLSTQAFGNVLGNVKMTPLTLKTSNLFAQGSAPNVVRKSIETNQKASLAKMIEGQGHKINNFKFATKSLNFKMPQKTIIKKSVGESQNLTPISMSCSNDEKFKPVNASTPKYSMKRSMSEANLNALHNLSSYTTITKSSKRCSDNTFNLPSPITIKIPNQSAINLHASIDKSSENEIKFFVSKENADFLAKFPANLNKDQLDEWMKKRYGNAVSFVLKSDVVKPNESSFLHEI